MPSELVAQLTKLLDVKDEKNYDPRMEELMRSDRLIDPKNECLSKLENPEIYHIAKIRGAQQGFRFPVKAIKKLYKESKYSDYHCDYIDFIRNMPDNEAETIFVGGLPMMSIAIEEMVKLRKSEDAWAAKLYADSIKPQVANQPMYMPMPPQEEKEGFFSKMWGWFFGGRQKQQTQQGNRGY
jgi:hypothetical protein